MQYASHFWKLTLFSKQDRRLKTSFLETILKFLKTDIKLLFWFFFSLGRSPFSTTFLPIFRYCYALFIPEIQNLLCWVDYSQFQLPTIFFFFKSSLPCSLPQRLTSMHFIIQALFSGTGIPAGQKWQSPHNMTVLAGCLDVVQGGRGLSLKAEANPEGTHSGRPSACWTPYGR